MSGIRPDVGKRLGPDGHCATAALAGAVLIVLNRKLEPVRHIGDQTAVHDELRTGGER